MDIREELIIPPLTRSNVSLAKVRMNRSSSSSKAGRKCSPALVPTPALSDPKIEGRKKQSSRNPLKDLNAISSSSSSSSTASTISNDAPKGCLRFFLSNSSSLRTPIQRRNTFSKTPKSAPNARPSKPSRSEPPKENPSKPTVSANPKRPTSQNTHKSKKNPPCLYQWQSGKKPSLKAGQKPKLSPVLNNSGISATKLASGSDELKQQQQLPVLVRMVDDAGEPSQVRLSGLKAGNDENFTPVSKLVCGPGLDCTFDKELEENLTTTVTTTPPIEASVSPEIQCGSSVVSKTPTCYGAGHVMSGVTDKRKCRPRGILAVGENDLGFDTCDAFDGFDNDEENVKRIVNSSRLSLLPSPTEASVHWLLSPCAEKDDDSEGLSGNACQAPSLRHSPPSPSSRHVFSSDVCNSSNTSNTNTTTSTSTSTSTSTRRRRRTLLLSPSGLLEFQGLLGPSSDPMVGCLLSSPRASTPIRKVVSQEENTCHQGENSRFSMDSLGSGNVIQTPQSDSTPDSHVGRAWLNAVDHQKGHFECQLDSVAEVLQASSFSPKSQISMWDPASSSFQFDRLTTPSDSIDFTQLQKTWDYHSSWISDSMLGNVSQSQMRISWREGLVSRIFEMDELDCCRCLSDEEEDAKDCSKDQFKSIPNSEFTKSLTNEFKSPNFLDHEQDIDEKGKEKCSLQKPSLSAESISTDGDGLVASRDYDWTLCYKNQLFKV